MGNYTIYGISLHIIKGEWYNYTTIAEPQPNTERDSRL
jgi:hypothetical protein